MLIPLHRSRNMDYDTPPDGLILEHYIVAGRRVDRWNRIHICVAGVIVGQVATDRNANRAAYAAYKNTARRAYRAAINANGEAI